MLQGKESPIAGLRRAYSATKMGSARNPLEKGEDGEEDELRPGEGDGQLTYELMNRDTGTLPINPFPNTTAQSIMANKTTISTPQI